MEAIPCVDVAFDTTVAIAATLGEISAGESEAECETEEKLSFFLKNSSLRLAFLLWVEGLVRFLSRVEFTFLSPWYPGKTKRKS